MASYIGEQYIISMLHPGKTFPFWGQELVWAPMYTSADCGKKFEWHGYSSESISMYTACGLKVAVAFCQGSNFAPTLKLP